MDIKEEKVCERFKEVRTSLKMKQGDFAKEIKTTQGHVSDIENKRKGVSDRVIEIICLKYKVNEDWLRTGVGEMYKEPDDEVAEIVSDLLEEDNPFYELIIGIMKSYQKLDSKSQELLKNLGRQLLDNLKKRD